MTPEDQPQQQTNTAGPSEKDAEDLQPEKRQKATSKDLLDLIIDQGDKPGGQRSDYARQLVDAELARNQFDEDWRLAKVFAHSGIFDDIKGSTPTQSIMKAMAKIQLGRSWGLGPADSMRFLLFTNGKPSIETDPIAARLREAGYDWDIQWHETKTPTREKLCIGCTLWIKKYDEAKKELLPLLDRDKKPVSVSFTKEDADNAQYYEKGGWKKLSDKWNYQSWPRDMYFSRCISRLRKYHVPHVMRGAVTPDQVEDFHQPPDGTETPLTGIVRGTREDQQRLADEKIAKMKENAPKKEETEQERNVRLHQQMEEQAKQVQQTEHKQESNEPVFTPADGELLTIADWKELDALQEMPPYVHLTEGIDAGYHIYTKDEAYQPLVFDPISKSWKRKTSKAESETKTPPVQKLAFGKKGQ